MTEDEIVGWYHQLNGHEFEQTQGNGEGQGSLRCCSSWGLTYLAAPGLSSGSCSMHTVQLWHIESRSLTRD